MRKLGADYSEAWGLVPTVQNTVTTANTPTETIAATQTAQAAGAGAAQANAASTLQPPPLISPVDDNGGAITLIWSSWFQKLWTQLGGAVPWQSGFGSAELDFGAFPGANSASLKIAGQTLLRAQNIPQAALISGSLGPFSDDEVNWLSTMLTAICSPSLAGDGFTITLNSREAMQGKFLVGWRW